jgi:1A family penicillin-binding protein
MNAMRHVPFLQSIPAIPVEILESEIARRRLGYLSGFSNALMVVAACFLGLVASLATPLLQQFPIEDTLRPAQKRPLLLISSDGQPFARRGDCVAEPVTLKDIPQHLVDAVVSMEDRRFYSHLGFDPLGILRAAHRNYSAGATREGGSTITQQLVKMSFLTNAKTLERKIDEVLLATWLELRLTKAQILERYLSSAYFGEGCFGARAAAKHFFNKPVGDLTVSESALMVALLRSPTQLTKNFDDARARARLVLQAMVREGRLTEAQFADLKPAALNPARSDELGGDYADWLADALVPEIQDPHSRQPIRVYTTFDLGLQRLAENAVKSVLDKRGGRAKAGQAALVAMRTDGRVVAMVGGRDRAASQFNRAVQARRQPGSSFKTFVYLTALAAGARPDSVMVDEPIEVDGWEPKNYGDSYRGSVTLTQAFASSINTIAVKLSEAVGRNEVIATAHNLGINSPLAPNPSLALGTSEVSLLELTSAYAAIAAGAYPIKPWGVAGLDVDPAGGGEPPPGAGVWKLGEAGTMRELLSAVIDHGTAKGAGLPIPAYGKTGTSQDYRDAWFIGFAGNLVVGVWIGNDDFTPMRRITGGSLPAEIWARFMRGAMKTDKHFERKLPRIAAFEARAKEPADRSSTLAWLGSDSTSVSVTGFRPGRGVASQFGQTLTGGAYDASRQYYDVPREGRGGGEVSRDFQSRLNDMGWPGQ